MRPNWPCELRCSANLLLIHHAINDVASRDQQNSLEFGIIDPLGVLLDVVHKLEGLLEVGQLRRLV